MRLNIFSILFFIIFITSCSSNDKGVNKSKDENDIQDSLSIIDTSKIMNLDSVIVAPIDSLELRLIEAGLVDIQSLDKSIQVDLKYSTTDNFVGIDMYGDLTKAYMQEDVAHRLVVVQTYLQSIDSNLSLLIYDAVRPRSVQQIMWDTIDKPFAEKIKFVSNPKNGSIHNYGAAIDLTLMDLTTNTALDMGAGYDDARRIAYPRHESEFLNKGELTKLHIKNRKLLRQVMAKGKFYVIQTEWWHFNACSRNKAKQLYQPIE